MRRYVSIDLQQMKTQGLSLVEWALLENIHFLSHNETGYCYASKEKLADHLNVSRSGLFATLKSLVERDFLEKNHFGHYRTTKKWIEIITDKHGVQNLDSQSKNGLTVQKLDSDSPKIGLDTVQKLDSKRDIYKIESKKDNSYELSYKEFSQSEIPKQKKSTAKKPQKVTLYDESIYPTHKNSTDFCTVEAITFSHWLNTLPLGFNSVKEQFAKTAQDKGFSHEQTNNIFERFHDYWTSGDYGAKAQPYKHSWVGAWRTWLSNTTPDKPRKAITAQDKFSEAVRYVSQLRQ